MYLQATVKNLRANRFIILSLLMMIMACGEERPAHRTTDTQTGTHLAKTASKPASADANWSMFMHDISYLGVSPDVTLSPPLALVWKFKTGDSVNSSPVVVGETVYVGSDDRRMYALHARKWGVKWEFEAGDRIICSPTFYNDMVYFSARDNKVYALDSVTGAKKWEFQADGWINSPVVAFRQRIYLGCYDNKIYVLNAVTGRKESQERSSIKIGNFKYISSQGDFYPIDAHSRANRWRQGLPISESWPATANNVVYIGTRDSKLYAFDSATHKEIWHFKTDGWVDSSPAIANGMLYVGSHDGYIYAFANADDPAVQNQDHDARKVGTVTHNRIKVYDRLDERAEIIAQLNEGRSLSITGEESENWYQVILPSGQTGWISAADFIPIRWSEGLQVNDTLVKAIKIVNLPPKAENPSWSPRGASIVFFDNISTESLYWKAKSIWLASIDGSDPKWVADGAFYNHRISWSGNGQWFALENLAHTQRQIWMVRYNGTGLRKVTVGEAPAISPAGDKIAFIRRNKASAAIWLHKLEDGKEEKLAEIPIKGEASYAAYGYLADLNLPSWSPDNSRLAVGLDGYYYSDNYSRIVVINVSDGTMKEIAFRSGRIKDIAWSPDISHLACVTQEHLARWDTNQLDKKVHLINIDSQIKEEVFDHCEGIAWSPDGKYMAFIEENDCMGMKRKIWLLDVKNHQRTQLLASKENIHRAFWLDNSTIAIVTSSTILAANTRTRGWIIPIVVSSKVNSNSVSPR